MIRVLLVHDVCLFRWALAEVLSRENDLEVAVSTLENAANRVRMLQPDVCVVDVDSATPVDMSALRKLSDSSGAPEAHADGTYVGALWAAEGAGGTGGTHVATRCREPAVRDREADPPHRGPALLVLGSAHRPGPLRRAFQADAQGFVDKEGSPGQLAAGIRQVAAGRRFVDRSLGFGFLQASAMPLTDRELSVLTLAAEGASVSEIAGALHLSNGTVRNYMSAITRKTGARNRVDAIRISQGEGWV